MHCVAFEVINKRSLPLTSVAEEYVFVMLRVQDAGTRRTAQSRVLVLDAVLTKQAGVVPLPTGSSSTLNAYSAVLRSKGGLLTDRTLKTIQTQCSMNCFCYTDLALMSWNGKQA